MAALPALSARQSAGDFAPMLEDVKMPPGQHFSVVAAIANRCLSDTAPTPIIAASDSVEGKLHSQGKHWIKTTGEIKTGDYVQDTLEGRLDQPKSRGAIGKVVSVSTDPGGQQAAKVDFGRNYTVGISFSELSLVNILPN
jgi:hypothetical protein